MRVISGVCRGFKLTAPVGNDTRPTADRFKETIFNILSHKLEGSRVLDLFSGSGALGIEALSRGAASAVFVDASKKSIDAINANLLHTRLVDNARVLHMNYQQAIKILADEKQAFDLIFLDPPYALGPTDAIELIVSRHMLSGSGIIVAEQASSDEIKISPLLEVFRSLNYTTTQFFFARLIEN